MQISLVLPQTIVDRLPRTCLLFFTTNNKFEQTKFIGVEKKLSELFYQDFYKLPHYTGEIFKQMLARKQNENIGSLILHSFGFGNDHDQNLMTKICSIKDGDFYFINKLSTLDEAFWNALGGIITQTATNIEINVECIAPAPLQGITISKVNRNKWNKITDQKYSISINQIISEVSKVFVFELSIPKTSFQALDALPSIQVLSATYSAIDTITQKKLQGKVTLELQFFDQSGVYKRESNLLWLILSSPCSVNSQIKHQTGLAGQLRLSEKANRRYLVDNQVSSKYQKGKHQRRDLKP